MPEISVLIPYYNDEDFLRESIQSVLDQTYTDFELVLINHACTDSSRKIARSFEDGRIVHIDLPVNAGAGVILDAFLKKARGTYVAINLYRGRYSFDFLRTLLAKTIETDNTICLSEIHLDDNKKNCFKYNNSLMSLHSAIDCMSEDYYIMLHDCPEIFSVENKLFDKNRLIKAFNNLRVSDYNSFFSELVAEYLSLFDMISIVHDAWISIHESFYAEHTEKLRASRNIAEYIVTHSKQTNQKITGFFESTHYERIPVKNCQKLDEIKNMIVSNDVISFDIFDTLLVRPFWAPEDLFDLLSVLVNENFDIPDFIDFRTLRIEAELKARMEAVNHEVQLHDIYAKLKQITGFKDSQLVWISEKEKELELSFCYARKTGVELLNFAKLMNKTVIITSDMYLDRNLLLKMLRKIGCNGFVKFYLSNEVKVNKHSGGLYKLIKKDFPQKNILHIGDNYQADCIGAQKNSLNCAYLPKTTDILFSQHSISSFFNKLYSLSSQDKGFYYHSANVFATNFRLRLLWKVTANILFDNPFVDFIPGSEFSANHYLMGVSVGGMFSYTFISEILRMEKEYDSIVFSGRDCASIYKMLHFQFPEKVKYKYLKVSRKSLFPLAVNETVGIQLNSIGLLNSVTPFDIFALTTECFECDKRQFVDFCKKLGIEAGMPFESQYSFSEFCSAYTKDYYSYTKSQQYKDKLRSYFDSFFHGRSLFVDMGYSGRVESIMSSVYGYDIQSLYLLHRGEAYNTRQKAKRLAVRTLLPFQAKENMWLRELLNSDISGSCIGYQVTGNCVSPLEKEVTLNYREAAIIRSYQRGMADYMTAIMTCTGAYREYIQLDDSLEGVLPFELFTITLSGIDRHSFSQCFFEDTLGLGDNVAIDGLFQYICYDFGVPENEVDCILNKSSKIKRALILYLLRRGIFNEKLKARLKICWFFKYLRTIYRLSKTIFRRKK